jgi:hypothetical protein
MTVNALDTAIGPPDDPKIQWHVQGRFDPVSFGDVSFDVVLELDQYARLMPVGSPVLDNNGWFSSAEFVSTDSGFHVRLRQS